MSAREEVLARVRDALGAGPSEAVVVPRGYRATGEHAPGSEEVLELLLDRLLDYRALVDRVPGPGLPAAIASALAGAGTVVVPDGVPADWVGALAGSGVAVVTDSPAAPVATADLVGVGAVLTGCRVAVAETGTIVLDAGPDQGRRVLTLVPDHHVCVVRAEQVVQTVPEAVALLDPTRPQTWVSGPSATSDIELSRVEGVHGPRRLHVLVVDG